MGFTLYPYLHLEFLRELWHWQAWLPTYISPAQAADQRSAPRIPPPSLRALPMRLLTR